MKELSPEFLQELKAIVEPTSLLTRPEELLVYDQDGLTIYKGRASAAVLPRTTEQVAKIVALCNKHKVPFIARGAGTSLSGGTIPTEGGVIIEFALMNHILEVDLENGLVLVEAGTANLSISEKVAASGYFYAPDPSSQLVCTIGGNISHNSGGPHTLKYGVTTHNLVAAEIILANGEIFWLGSKAPDRIGYDLLSLLAGSDGTLAIVTKALLKIIPKPQDVRTMMASFETPEDASRTVSNIIAAGVLPSAVEMMDDLVIGAVEDSIHAAGYPRDAGAVLLVEVDGRIEDVEDGIGKVLKICRANSAKQVKVAADEHERKKLWAGRKGAFASMGRLGPNYIVQDGVIPRTKLPEILAKIYQISNHYSLKIANVFHAGDGNLHPLIIYDAAKGETEKAVRASGETLKICVDVGGTITGEHGIGIEKRDLMPMIFNGVDLDMMMKVKETFDPERLCNPCKTLPFGSRCAELFPSPKIEK
ncbi:MAG: FAD-binding protein [Thaumarchaeota archaeon]|nr:FAD-binding protein [Nitrososphaerota archaeon]